MKPFARNLKLGIFVVVLVALAVVARLRGWDQALLSTDGLDRMGTWVMEHPVGAAITYVLVSVVACVAFALPGITFALVAGVLFGALWGTLLCWVAVVIGACLAFLLGRYGLKDALKPKLARNEALNRLLFENALTHAMYLLAVTRLVPIFPYNLQNFAYGITDIGFGSYAFYSALFMLPGTAAYTVAAAGLISEGDRILYFAVAAVLMVATLVVARWLRRRAGV